MSLYLEIALFIGFNLSHGYCIVTAILITKQVKTFGAIWARPFKFFTAAFAILSLSSLTAFIGTIVEDDFLSGHGLWLSFPILVAAFLFLYGLRWYKNILTSYSAEVTSCTLHEIKTLTESIYGRI